MARNSKRKQARLIKRLNRDGLSNMLDAYDLLMHMNTLNLP